MSDASPPTGDAFDVAGRGRAGHEPEIVDSGVLLTTLRMQGLSRGAMLDELTQSGLTLAEATDVLDGDVSVRLSRVDGKLSVFAPAPVAENPLSGIRGWLVLPAIQLCVAPLVLARDMAGAIEQLRELDESALPSEGARGLLVTAIVLGAVLLVLCLVTFFFFFGRKRLAPHLFVVLHVAGVVATVILVIGLANRSMPAAAGLLTITIRTVASAIWIAYFLTSQRVRNTFTR